MCKNSLKLDLFFFGVTSCFISILLEFMFDSLDLFSFGLVSQKIQYRFSRD